MNRDFRYMNVPCESCYHFDWQKDIYAIKSKMSKLLEKKINNLCYGFCSDEDFEEDVEDLELYLGVLTEELRLVALGGKPCLKNDDLQDLSERIKELTTGCSVNNTLGVDVDRTGVDSWLKVNPYCSSREEWERCSYAIFDNLTLDISSVFVPTGLSLETFTKEQVYNLSFDIVTKKINVDVIVALAVAKISDNLNLKVQAKSVDYLVDFKLLAAEVPGLNLNFSTMVKAIEEYNLSLEVIKTIYKHDLQLVSDDEKGLLLKTDSGAYPIRGFDFKEIPSEKVIFELGVTEKESKYLLDCNKFIEDLDKGYC